MTAFKIRVDPSIPPDRVLVVSNPRAPAILHAASLRDDGLLALALLSLGRDRVTLAASHDPDLFDEVRTAARQVGMIVVD